MALDNITRSVTYIGNGAQREFPFSFPVYKESDITVYRSKEKYLDTMVANTEYLVRLNSTGAGTVSFFNAPAAGSRIAIVSTIPADQTMQLTNYGGFDASTLNAQADKQTALIQQLEEEMSRALKVNPTSDATPEQLLHEALLFGSGAKDYAEQFKQYCADIESHIGAARQCAIDASEFADEAAASIEEVRRAKDEAMAKQTEIKNIIAEWELSNGRAGAYGVYRSIGDTPAGHVIDLPDGVVYRVGAHMLRLALNGLILEEQGEVGDVGSWSTKLCFNFPLPANSVLTIWVAPLGGAGAGGAGAAPIKATKSGAVIRLDDSANQGLDELVVYGRTLQGATPTPDAPVRFAHAYNSNVIIQGKNLLYVGEPRTQNGLTVNYGTQENGIVVRGTVQTDGDEVVLYDPPGWVDFPVGTSLTTTKYKASDFSPMVAWYNNAGTFINSQKITDVGATATAKPPATAFSVAIGLQKTATTGQVVDDIVQAQVEVGTTSTAYEAPIAPVKVELPFCLCAMPVTSGGNYTDASGQQWLADELHMKSDGTGYIRRNVILIRLADEPFTMKLIKSATALFRFAPAGARFDPSTQRRAYCNVLAFEKTYTSEAYISAKELITHINGDNESVYLSVLRSRFTPEPSEAAMQQWLVEKDVHLLAPAATPFDEPVSKELVGGILSQIKTLYPTTTLRNSFGAGMRVTYCADTQAYIDNKLNAMRDAVVTGA